MEDYNLDDFFKLLEERKTKKASEKKSLEMRPELENFLNEISDYTPEN